MKTDLYCYMQNRERLVLPQGVLVGVGNGGDAHGWARLRGPAGAGRDEGTGQEQDGEPLQRAYL